MQKEDCLRKFLLPIDGLRVSMLVSYGNSADLERHNLLLKYNFYLVFMPKMSSSKTSVNHKILIKSSQKGGHRRGYDLQIEKEHYPYLPFRIR